MSPTSRLPPELPGDARAPCGAACAVAVGAVVFLLGLAAVLLSPSRDHVAAWWPAAGVAAGAAVLTSGWRRLWVLIAVAVGSFAAALAAGRPTVVAAGLAAAGTAEAALVGHLLGRSGRPQLTTLSELGGLLAVAGAGSVLAGGIAVALVADRLGGGPWSAWLSVTASHGVAVMLIVPQVMRLPVRRTSGQVAVVELIASWVVLVAVTVAVFWPAQWLPLTFLPVAALVWTGLRLSARTAAVQLVVVGALTSWLTAFGAGPFTLSGPTVPPVTLVQVFLLVCALVVFALTISVAQRDGTLAALADRREFDEAVLESVSAGVVACDANGAVLLCNAEHRRFMGMADEQVEIGELVTHQPADGVEPPDRSALRRAMAGEEVVNQPLQIGPPGGPLYDIIMRSRQIHAADGRLLGAVATFSDVTAERAVQAQLRESAAFHDAVLAVIPDIIYIVDVSRGRTRWASRTLASILGYGPDELVDRGYGRLSPITHPEDRALLADSYRAAQQLADGEVLPLRIRVKDGSGQYRWLSRLVTPFNRDGDGKVRQLLGTARDITEIVEVEERLARAALHDPLTGLPNRRLLGERLTATLARAAADGETVGVLFCDLDGFKRVNDTGGHAAGDAVLMATADRLQAVLRREDTVARVGGDEFVVILGPPPRPDDDAVPALERLAQIRSRAYAVAARIEVALAAPVTVEGRAHAVTVSVGVYLAAPGTDADATLRAADSAMYRAKNDRPEPGAPDPTG